VTIVTRKFGARRLLLAVTAAAVAAASAAAIFAASAPAAPAPGWSALIQADGAGNALTAVTCPAVSLCVGVDSQGHSTWSSTPAANAGWQQNTGAGLASPSSVACPQATLCVATEPNGQIAATGNSTGAWTSTTVDGSNALTGVSCPTTGLCVAVDHAGGVLWSANPTTGPWTARTVIDTTTTTTTPAPIPLNAISCPTTGLCAAVDSAGNVLVSTAPTSGSWQKRGIGSTSLNDIACTSAGACVAVDVSGNVFATANAITAPATWSATPVDPGHVPTAVSCGDAGLCVFVDDSGTAFSSDSFTAARPTWTAAAVDPGGDLTSVACNAAGFCVAVDSVGRAVTATSPLPAPTTGTGTAADQMDATVTASVDPGDAAPTDCHFDYGATTAYGASVPCASTPAVGGGSQAVSAQIGGLAAGTTYHFRVAAATAVASATGADATFTTPPPLKPNPSLSGTPAIGSTLTCKPNVATTASEVVAVQWLSDTAPIPSANTPTYVVQPTDATHHLSCQVTISGDGGSATATSGFDAIPAQAGPKITESFAGTATDSARTVKVPVTCSPQAASQCTFTLTLTTTQTVNYTVMTVPIGSSKATLGPGATGALSVSLSASGRTLLNQKHTLQVLFTLKGTLLGTLTATLQTAKFKFTAPKPKPKKHTTQPSKKKKTVKKAGANATPSRTR
jgi:hypothetical protein